MMPRQATYEINTKPCSVCGTVIRYKADIARHRRLHSLRKSELMLNCPLDGCDYKSLQKSNVKTHYFRHTGEKPYACPDCPFRTGDPGSLTRHKKKAHGYIPNSCPKTKKATAKTRRSRRHAPYNYSRDSSEGLEDSTSPSSTALSYSSSSSSQSSEPFFDLSSFLATSPCPPPPPAPSTKMVDNTIYDRSFTYAWDKYLPQALPMNVDAPIYATERERRFHPLRSDLIPYHLSPASGLGVHIEDSRSPDLSPLSPSFGMLSDFTFAEFDNTLFTPYRTSSSATVPSLWDDVNVGERAATATTDNKAYLDFTLPLETPSADIKFDHAWGVFDESHNSNPLAVAPTYAEEKDAFVKVEPDLSSQSLFAPIGPSPMASSPSSSPSSSSSSSFSFSGFPYTGASAGIPFDSAWGVFDEPRNNPLAVVPPYAAEEKNTFVKVEPDLSSQSLFAPIGPSPMASSPSSSSSSSSYSFSGFPYTEASADIKFGNAWGVFDEPRNNPLAVAPPYAEEKNMFVKVEPDLSSQSLFAPIGPSPMAPSPSSSSPSSSYSFSGFPYTEASAGITFDNAWGVFDESHNSNPLVVAPPYAAEEKNTFVKVEPDLSSQSLFAPIVGPSSMASRPSSSSSSYTSSSSSYSFADFTYTGFTEL